jgi:DNA-binding CsgD family transcriptional regulator/PAS domain-containing protein
VASETELLRLALAAYEAAAQPELWFAFLKQYAEATAADAAFLQIHDLAAHASVMLSGFGIASPLRQSYNEYYSKINVWRERGRTLYVPGTVNLDQEQCPRSVLERSEFYHDCLKRFGVVFSMGAVIAREGERAPTLSCLRNPSKHAFDEAEREVARFLLPHLARAWTIVKRLELLSAGESVLDTLPLGVVFLASGGAAIYWNRAAEEIFGSNDGLCLRNGVLTALDKVANAHLSNAIDSALAPCKPPGPVAAISVPRPSLRRDYQVVAAPLLGSFRQFTGAPRPAALALITEPEQKQPASTHLLMQLYKLTRKEAAIASKLSEGKSIERAGEELSVTYETARTHLRRIFSKTGTSRQAELLLLIARLPVIGNGSSHG